VNTEPFQVYALLQHKSGMHKKGKKERTENEEMKYNVKTEVILCIVILVLRKEN
jgi:hypothetical protein